MTLNRLLLTVILLFSLGTVNAQLIVIPSRTDVTALEKNQTIRVYNKGEIPLYLEVALERVENPGQTPERKIPIGLIQQAEMIFHPARITLGPKQERNINLIPLKIPAQETLYRLYITPVTQTQIKGGDDKKINVPVTIGVLVAT